MEETLPGAVWEETQDHLLKTICRSFEPCSNTGLALVGERILEQAFNGSQRTSEAPSLPHLLTSTNRPTQLHLEGLHHLQELGGGDTGTVQQEPCVVIDVEAQGLADGAEIHDIHQAFHQIEEHLPATPWHSMGLFDFGVAGNSTLNEKNILYGHSSSAE